MRSLGNIKGWAFPILFFVLIICTLGACSPVEKPASQMEVATRGAYSAALSTEAGYALVGSINHGANFWDLAQGERLYDWNHKPKEFSEIIASDISASGEFALTASSQELVLWQTKTGEALTFWNAPAEILAVSLSRSGKYALLGLANHTAVLFDAKKGGVMRTLNHDNRVRSVHLSADSRYAVTGGDDNKARFWDIQANKLLHTREHGENVQLVRLSPDGQTALSVSKYDQALLWDTQTGEAIATLNIHGEALKRGKSFTAAQFSADGNQLLTGSSNREVILWDTLTMAQLKKWRLTKRKWMKPTGATVLALAFNSEGATAIGSNGLLYILQ